jgi:hypothetical protein
MNEIDELDGEIRRILAEVGDAAGVPPRFDELAALAPDRRRSPGRRLVAASAAVVVAAAAGVVALRPESSETPSTPPAVAVSSASSDSTMVPSTMATSTAPAPSIAADVWFLPTVLPAGYELTDLSARTDPANPLGSDEQTWVRRGDDGRTIVGWVTAQSTPGHAEVGDQPGATVHGQPASLTPFSDDGSSWTVSWFELDASHLVQATDVSAEAAVAIAEASTVSDGFIDLESALSPRGYESLAPDTTPATNQRDTVFLLALPTEGTGAIWADVTSPSRSLDHVALDENERRLVEGTEVSILTRPADARGPFTIVRFTRDGWLYNVTGRTELDTVLAFALALQPATAADASAAADAITERVRQLPERARATFADGTTVTARTLESLDGAIALCLEAPIIECHRVGTETTLAGRGEPQLYELFELAAGRRLIVGWQAHGTPATTSDGTPIQTVDTSGGRFLRIDVTGSDIPAIRLNSTDAPTEVHLSPNRRP